MTSLGQYLALFASPPPGQLLGFKLLCTPETNEGIFKGCLGMSKEFGYQGVQIHQPLLCMASTSLCYVWQLQTRQTHSTLPPSTAPLLESSSAWETGGYEAPGP